MVSVDRGIVLDLLDIFNVNNLKMKDEKQIHYYKYNVSTQKNDVRKIQTNLKLACIMWQLFKKMDFTR